MRRVGWIFALASMATFCVGPFVWQLLTSVRPESDLVSLGLPVHPTLESYRRVLYVHGFARAMANSLLVAAATTFATLLLAAPAAFALAKLPVPGQRLFLAATLSISMFPPIATVSPLYLLMRALGLRDQVGGLVLPYATFALPLALWLLAGFFREIPDELYRAARIDGCTPFSAFRKILLPLAAPGLGTTAILIFISAWNELLYAVTFLSSVEKRTIPPAILLFGTERVEPWGEIAAASVLTTLPLLVATLVFQRRIVSGLTAGAVKG